ncbi:class I SAM-dependent methyltransferase [Saccharopolyspora sp. SCSIO 74807]|uniref:class I SAM-dependent methyltransferase n=1 Tax=Saccharopolyspora sp. SCSIO 74807 TaxID=3118084 RepID=UPI0030CE7862
MYEANPHMYGDDASAPARHAAERFAADGTNAVLELGSGHGRDALHFARRGFLVHATDFSATALDQLRTRARQEGTADRISTLVHDVRTPLPLPDGSADAAFAHMLLCMALFTEQIHDVVTEIRRVLRPGGRLVYTARHTGDSHYGTGIDHGDDIHEHGGFAVHYFDRALVDSLARGWNLAEVHAFEEGGLPRKLWRVEQVKP